MKNRKVYVTTFCGVAVAMNIVLGIITSALGIPLYLDTLGTVLSAAILGPVPGIIVGALSNIITGLIYSVSDIPFCLVNMAVGLIVGLVAKKWKFGIVPAVITGIALSFICPAIGTPIGIYVYGGLNGSVSDMLVMSLVQELSMQRSKSLQEIREKGMQYGFEDIMSASLGAYASLYEKINEGYENGTREVWVADEKMGKRKLSKEEEIDRLNNAYKREIEWQTMVMNSRKETEKARNITVFGNQINIDAANDKDDSDKLFELMDDMKDEYLLCRKNEDYNKNIQGVSNIVSSILSRFDLKNHMINIFEGISLSK